MGPIAPNSVLFMHALADSSLLVLMEAIVSGDTIVDLRHVIGILTAMMNALRHF